MLWSDGEHLQRCGRFFAEAPDAAQRLNDLTIQMNPASMNFGCTAVSLIIQLSKEIRCEAVAKEDRNILPRAQ